MKWIIFTAVVLALFGGIIWFSKSNEKTFTGDATKPIVSQSDQAELGDNVFGSTDNKVVLIEYGDYQCPGCGAMHAPVKELTEKYKDKVTFIFRNMPLTNIHPNAYAAAAAAEAAGLQGKYYEMHDLLYAEQDAWTNATVDNRAAIFEGYATQLGLNIDQYRQDVGDKRVSDKIARDKSTATSIFGLDSTPTFVLNGTVIKGQDAVSADALTAKVEEAIKAAYGEDALQTTEATNETQQ